MKEAQPFRRAISVSLALAAAAPLAWSQDSRATSLEEVVVYARKIDENKQTVPISMVVNSGEQLEAAQIVEKSDITEEIARIRSHVGQMISILDNGPAVGRKLDFLLQELNREVNTIASKSGDQVVLGHAIDMKAEIERAREQAQNLQ